MAASLCWELTAEARRRAPSSQTRGSASLGEGMAGPSNPLRVGIGERGRRLCARRSIKRALRRACSASTLSRPRSGLAGVRRGHLRLRMREALSGLGIESIEVVTDADIALFGATEGKPGLVIIAGTGSVCCGINARGKHVCAGGWGPLAGDEGSGSWIARSALQAVARAIGRARRGNEFWRTAACDYFNVATTDDLSTAIYAPSMTNDRIAGFGKRVIEAAKSGDEVAREIVRDAGRELGIAAAAVIRKLRMGRERFQVAYVGGVFAAGDLILDPLRAEIARVAPQAYLAPPLLSPGQGRRAHGARAVTQIASRGLKTVTSDE